MGEDVLNEGMALGSTGVKNLIDLIRAEIVRFAGLSASGQNPPILPFRKLFLQYSSWHGYGC